MTLAIDGSAVGTYAGDTCTITTGGAGDIIVAMGYYGNGVFTVSDTAALTWTTALNVTLGSYNVLIAWAYSAAKLTSDVISVGSGGYTLDAVAISGADTVSPIDATATSAALPVALTTVASNTIALCGASGGPATAGSGSTLIDSGSANFMPLEYQIFSSAGAKSLTFGGGMSDGFAVSIKAASGGGGATDDRAFQNGAMQAITLMRERASGLLEPVRELWKPKRPKLLIPGFSL